MKVLDEADRLLLNEGLSASIHTIFEALRKKPGDDKRRYQLLLFSATMTDDTWNAIDKFAKLKDPFTFAQGPTYVLSCIQFISLIEYDFNVKIFNGCDCNGYTLNSIRSK
jgi:hypothetical protein